MKTYTRPLPNTLTPAEVLAQGACPIKVYTAYSYGSHYCGKPVKRLDRCGLHASVVERAVKKKAERLARYEAERARQAEQAERVTAGVTLANALRAALREHLELGVSLGVTEDGKCLVIPVDDAMALLDRLTPR